jgi:hypothetical protein
MPLGIVYVEFNGRAVFLIIIKTGSGLGDPLSSILILIATESLKILLVPSFLELN